MLHGTGISTYVNAEIYGKLVGKYSSPMGHLVFTLYYLLGSFLIQYEFEGTSPHQEDGSVPPGKDHISPQCKTKLILPTTCA